MAVLGLVLAACGSADTEAEAEMEEAIEAAAAVGESDVAMQDKDDMPEAMDDMEEMEAEAAEAMEDGAMEDGAMEEMSMGDPDATPAAEVEGADVTEGDFALLDSRPDGFDELAGTAAIARHDGTTITIDFTGLEANSDYISHLHTGPCTEGGGPHFKFDPDGADVPPNEIHLAFTSSDGGDGFMTVENDMVASDEGQSVVVHLAGQGTERIACAQL